LSHAGWKGTLHKIGEKTIEAMAEFYQSKAEDIVVCIGPSICQDCYEVSEEVALEFEKLLEDINADLYLPEITDFKEPAVIKPGKEKGKYQLDLWLANLLILLHAGIPLQQIQVTDVCTCHNPDYLFSHRASEGKRGNLAAFLMLK